jgi:hypothetical protein
VFREIFLREKLESENPMFYIWHEWKNKRDLLKSIEVERKAANERIWKRLNTELRVARKNKDWDKSNHLKVQIANYRSDKRGSGRTMLKFDARHGFSKWNY